MRSSSEPSTQEVLAGLVERVTFHNVENGFCVLRAKARGHRDLVTIVGHAAIIAQLADGRAAVVTCQPFALAADMSAANAAMSPASHFWSIGVDGGFHQSDDVAGPTSSA